MSESNWCKKCGVFIFRSDNREHECNPKWDVWGEDICREERADAIEVYAIEGQYAAEGGVEKDERESGDGYSVAEGTIVRVFVSQDGSNEIKQFTVSGEVVPQYSAREMEPLEIQLIDQMEKDGWKYDTHWDEFRKVVRKDGTILGRLKVKLRKIKKEMEKGKTLSEIVQEQNNLQVTNFVGHKAVG